MPRRTVRRTWFVGVLVVSMAVSASLQFGFGVLAPFITAEFGLSRTQYGTGASVLFMSAVAISLLAGRVVPRWRTSLLLRAVLVAAVVALAVISLAPGWPWIIVGAVIMGVPLGLMNPVTNQLIAGRVNRAVQGTVTGIKQSGVQLGALVIGVALPVVATTFGWRTAVGALAGAALVAVLMTLPLADPDRARKRDERASGSPSQDPALRGASTGRPSPVAVLLGLYAIGMGFGVGAVNAFLPLFAYEELGVSAGRAGQLIALIGLLGTAARVVTGIVLDRVHRIESWLWVLAAVAALSLALVFLTPGRPSLVWVMAMGLGLSATAWQTVVMLAAIRDGKETARSSGIVTSGFMVGMMLGPLVFGILADSFSYAMGWVSVGLGFVIAVVIGVAAARRPNGHRRRSSASRAVSSNRSAW
jgi:predicted MFS family arabinose efflux permease